MFSRREMGIRVAAFARLFAAGALVGTAAAPQSPDQHAGEKREKNVEAGETEAKRLLLLMDKDKNGKVSKQEFMSFMEAEFDRLDVNKDGELDVKELTKTRVHIGGAIHR